MEAWLLEDEEAPPPPGQKSVLEFFGSLRFSSLELLPLSPDSSFLELLPFSQGSSFLELLPFSSDPSPSSLEFLPFSLDPSSSPTQEVEESTSCGESRQATPPLVTSHSASDMTSLLLSSASSYRKPRRRRVCATPGGLHWGRLQKDEPLPDTTTPDPGQGGGGGATGHSGGLTGLRRRDNQIFPNVFGSQGPATSGKFRIKSQQMSQNQNQNQNLDQTRRPAGPTSPYRLYRNLSEKLRVGTGSFHGTAALGSDWLMEAVEQQDLDQVQDLLARFSLEELDLNRVGSWGLTPLDVALMTNNGPVTRVLMRAGAKESPHLVSAEVRQAHLQRLAEEAELRASQLWASAQQDGLPTEAQRHHGEQRSRWEWRSRLYRRMSRGVEQTSLPEPPAEVVLSVCGSASLGVAFREPISCWNSFITKYRVEWSSLEDFSVLIGAEVLENIQNLQYRITGLSEGRVYYVRVSAYNMKGWGPPAPSTPPSAAPSNWRGGEEGRSLRRRGQTEALERLLQQVRAMHTLAANADMTRATNASRKPSVSRSLRNMFNSPNKFIKTLKRGVYLVVVCYHGDRLLLTNEDQLPVVEVDDQNGGFTLPDFLWFTKLSLMWEDVGWLRQTTLGSAPSSSSLQVRLRMLAAANTLQNLLGLEDLGHVHYEPIRDRHGNTLLVTVSDATKLNVSGRWRHVDKLTNNRKSLEEEPHVLDILVARLTDLLAYQRSWDPKPLPPGLYLGFLKFRSSLDQIKVVVPNRKCNMLGHAHIRHNPNVSREEWRWIQSLGAEPKEEERRPAPPLSYELKAALLTMLTDLSVPTEAARDFLLYKQEVVELGHNVNFLLLLLPSEDVSSSPWDPPASYRLLPLHEFQLVHLASYRQRYVSLCCRLAVVLQLDVIVTSHVERQALTQEEVGGARGRSQEVQRYLKQLQELRGDASEPRWLTAALKAAHDKLGVPISLLLETNPEGTELSGDSGDDVDHTPLGAELSRSPTSSKPHPQPTPEGVSLPGRRRLLSQTYISHASCVLEQRHGQQPRPHLFPEWAGPEGQEVDSDESSDAQISEILSSVL